MTISTVDTIDTTLTQDGQAAGSITPADIRVVSNSMAGMPISRAPTSSTTALLTDRGSLIEMNVAASANSVTLPTNAVAPFDIGTMIGLRQMGTGASSFATAGTPTLRTATATLSCRAQYSVIFAHKRATDEWVIYGDLT